MGRCNQTILGDMNKSSNKTGLQCFMQYQHLAALHLSALDTLESLASHLYSFCLQEKVAQSVLQTHSSLKKLVPTQRC